MTDGWIDRRNRTLLNFLVSSGGNSSSSTYQRLKFNVLLNN